MSVNKKEKLMIEMVISDISIFVSSLRVIKPEYFTTPMDEVTRFVLEYHAEHNGVPSADIVDAEIGVKLKPRTIDASERSYILQEIELFCRESAMRNALMKSADIIHDSERLQEVESFVREALMVRIDNTVGTDLFEDSFERISSTKDVRDTWYTGIEVLDDLIGGTGVGEIGSIFAETSGGKSVLLANIVDRLARDNKDVLVISLEMSENMYAQRIDSIMTDSPIGKHSEMAAEISEALDEIKATSGRVTIKRLPYGSTVADVRAIAMEYELLYGKMPHSVVADYMGLMSDGNGGKSGAFEEMENIAFGFKDLMEEIGSRCFTAGQLNREGYDVVAIRPNHVAGGISLINALDWAVGMAQTEQDIDNNQAQLVQMKVRSHLKTRDPNILYRCPKTLRMQSKPFTYDQKSKSVKSDVKGSSKTANNRNKVKKELTNSGGKAKLASLLKL